MTATEKPSFFRRLARRNWFTISAIVIELLFVLVAVLSLIFWTREAGVFFGAFALMNVSITNAVLSLHYSSLGSPRPGSRRR